MCSSVNIPHRTLCSEYGVCEASLEQSDDFCRVWDFTPSWQNTFDAVMRRKDDFKIFGAYKGDEIVGYCIFEPGSGDVTQIAIDKAHCRKGLASALLSKAL